MSDKLWVQTDNRTICTCDTIPRNAIRAHQEEPTAPEHEDVHDGWRDGLLHQGLKGLLLLEEK